MNKAGEFADEGRASRRGLGASPNADQPVDASSIIQRQDSACRDAGILEQEEEEDGAGIASSSR